MHTAFISIGSNIDPWLNVERALGRLEQRYGTLRRSRAYRSEAVGFDGPAFLNLVVSAEACEPPLETWHFLRSLEYELGRRRHGSELTSRPIDLDLLLVDELVIDEPPLHLPHKDIMRYSFVLVPLTDLAAKMKHPIHGRSLAALLSQLDLAPRQLEQVSLSRSKLR